MTFLTLITTSAPGLQAGDVLAQSDDLAGAIDALIAYRDTETSQITNGFRALIIDPDGLVVARIMGGDDADLRYKLALVWNRPESELQIDAYASAVDPEDRRAVPLVITVATVAAVDNSVDDPMDNPDEEEMPSDPVEPDPPAE